MHIQQFFICAVSGNSQGVAEFLHESDDIEVSEFVKDED
jgi:hypothetical protein